MASRDEPKGRRPATLRQSPASGSAAGRPTRDKDKLTDAEGPGSSRGGEAREPRELRGGAGDEVKPLKGVDKRARRRNPEREATRPMRLLVLQDYLRSGGTERQSVLLADAFEGRGADTTLLTFRPGGPLAGTVARAVHESLQPFDTGLDWWAPGLLRRLKSLEPDLVLCMGRMANCKGSLLMQGLPGTPIVGTMRTGKALPRAYAEFLRRACHVVANSADARDTLRTRYTVAPDKVSVIGNPVVFQPAQEKAPERRRQERAAQGAAEQTRVLLNVGMFRREKGQRELIELCLELPRELDWQLWLVGDGPELGGCVRLAGELGLSGRVRFLGWKANPEACYAAADFAVHASGCEGLSNFLLEAQAHGLPCVAYEAQGNGECMVPGTTGHLVRQGDRQAFRNALLELARESDELRRLRADRARRHVRETFDEGRLVSAYLGLFERLCTGTADERLRRAQ